ncbi:MAG: hypothetical protein Q8K97_04025 [Pseudohongiella sp.]|nr:hypothetical protein [Pseudohongiella sp.]
MSLVNDMLRDLDARRRDAPSHAVGAEKLVPAAERAAKEERSRLGVFAVLMALVLAGLLVIYLALTNAGSTRISPPGQIAQVAETPVSDSVAMAEPELVAQSEIQAVSQVTPDALSQLELRLQQLEAQNQSLLAAQQREQAQAYNPPTPAPEQPAESLLQNSSVASSPAISQSFSQEWADAPAQSTDPAPVQQNTSQMSVAASTTRSPRALDFQDRDRQQVQLALQQWASGQQLTALQTLDSFAHQNPDAHQSRETLAKLLLQQGESERAMHVVELGLALSPNNNAYRKIKARLLVADGRASDAVALLTNLAPSVSTDSEYHDLMASSYMANQQYDFAAQTYRTLLQQNAGEGRWWYGLAAALDAQGLAQDAALSYERALQQANLTAGLRQASQQRLQLIRQSSAAR